MKLVRKITHQSKALISLLFFVTLTGCSTNPVTGKQNVVLMSQEQEIALGKQSHQQILKQYEVYNDPKLQAVVSRVGQALAAQSHRQGLKFTFTVLDSPEINAFALPGGYIYITRGIIAYLNSEQELAGVIGHEIGHVTARHGVRQHTAQTASSILGVALAVLTNNQSLAQTSGYIGSALISGYGRKHELEADRLGAEYLARINYDPETMLDVIGVLKNQELFANEAAKSKGEQPRQGYHGLFSSHPANDQRLQEVIQAAKRFQTENPKSIDPKAFLNLSNGMAYGDSQAQGIIKKNDFYHLDLDLHIRFPQGWQLMNQPSHLLSISPDKKQLIQFALGEKATVKPRLFLQKAFPSLRSGESRGRDTYAGVTALKTPWGQRDSRVAAVQHKDNMYVFLGLGEGKVPNDRFFNTIGSLGKLTRNEKILAQGKKLKIIRARSGDTFAKLARRSNLDEFQISRLRLLNGLYPKGEPTPGKLIKIVE